MFIVPLKMLSSKLYDQLVWLLYYLFTLKKLFSKFCLNFKINFWQSLEFYFLEIRIHFSMISDMEVLHVNLFLSFPKAMLSMLVQHREISSLKSMAFSYTGVPNGFIHNRLFHQLIANYWLVSCTIQPDVICTPCSVSSVHAVYLW